MAADDDRTEAEDEEMHQITEVHYFDKDMNPCPQEDAVYADVHGVDKKGRVVREWLEPPGASGTLIGQR